MTKQLLSGSTYSSITICSALICTLAAVGCTERSGPTPNNDVITVFNAGALARPVRTALDSFAKTNHVSVQQENAGSLETVRKLTELGRTPDVIALADTSLFSRFLAKQINGPVVPLGRTRMVLAYTPRSRFANEISLSNWYQVLPRPGVEVGRSDANLDPAGYRALFVMQLAERYYAIPGLARTLERAAPLRNVRPKSADLIALLQTGNLDYAWEYESVALSMGLRYLRLPPQIDLGDPNDVALYVKASVVLRASGTKGPVLLAGAPIVFGAATPLAAPHGKVGRQFITYIMSPEGRSILSGYHLEPMSGQNASTAK